MNQVLLIALAAVNAIVLVAAAWLMLRVSDKDVLLASRVSAAQGRWRHLDQIRPQGGSGMAAPLQRLLGAIGRSILQSGLLLGRTRMELEQTLGSCGFRGPNALAMFLGTKLVLVLLLPPVFWVVANLLGLAGTTRLMALALGFIAGLLVPDMMVRRIRSAYLAKLEEGLPDALDLMVICAQAGLSLEPAIARVASEMRMARPEVYLELEQTVRELEIMADAQVALGNLSQRTGLATLQRLVSTLIQTMQYGTPLTSALRNLSAEVRQAALTRFEGRAARLWCC